MRANVTKTECPFFERKSLKDEKPNGGGAEKANGPRFLEASSWWLMRSSNMAAARRYFGAQKMSEFGTFGYWDQIGT